MHIFFKNIILGVSTIILRTVKVLFKMHTIYTHIFCNHFFSHKKRVINIFLLNKNILDFEIRRRRRETNRQGSRS